MRCADARNGIFNTLLIMSCSHLPTTVIESKCTYEIAEGWGIPASFSHGCKHFTAFIKRFLTRTARHRSDISNYKETVKSEIVSNYLNIMVALGNNALGCLLKLKLL